MSHAGKNLWQNPLPTKLQEYILDLQGYSIEASTKEVFLKTQQNFERFFRKIMDIRSTASSIKFQAAHCKTANLFKRWYIRDFFSQNKLFKTGCFQRKSMVKSVCSRFAVCKL